jgi:NDP-sugar pyrophosphorylase family protein
MTLPPLAILAGGLATRLRPITVTIPKSLVEVGGEPFLAHQLRLAHRQGFREIVMMVGHMGDQIERFAGDGSRFGVRIRYAHDGATQRGTGGALRAALPMLGDETFLLYGDSYLNVAAAPVYAAFRASKAAALMTVFHNRNQWDPSNIVFDGTMVLKHDKSNQGQPGVEWIDYGLSVFSTEVVASWPEPDPFDLSVLTRELARQGRLAGYEVKERFYEIGKPDGLAETERYILSNATIGR